MHGMYNLKVTLGADRLLTEMFSGEFDFVLFRSNIKRCTRRETNFINPPPKKKKNEPS
jgi:hypothetical protein